MYDIKLTAIRKNPADKKWDRFFSVANAENARNFHEGIPEYEKTPLVCLSNLAGYLGIKGIYVKDESSRFGLNAFKGLGGSYAVSKYIAGLLGKDEISFEEIVSPEVREIIKDVTFVTATDGNHGRGIAWTSKKLGVNYWRCFFSAFEKNSSTEQLFFLELELLNPLSVLKKGYSVVNLGDKAVTSYKEVKKKDILDIRLSEGILKVETIESREG